MPSAGFWTEGFKTLDIAGWELRDVDGLTPSTTGCGSEFESMLCLCEEVRGGIALGPRRGSDAIFVLYKNMLSCNR